MFLRLCLALTLLVPSNFVSVSHASDEECAKMWFGRNLIAHRAGYCFKSNLGKAIFGNEGCSGSGPKLSELERQQMAAIAGAEKDWQCKIDTQAHALNIPDKLLIEALEIPPVRDDTESGCTGYLGRDIALKAGPYDAAAKVGFIRKGLNYGNSHLSVNGYGFYEVGLDSVTVAMGWTNVDVWREPCEMFAG